jgi:hypothetical protein
MQGPGRFRGIGAAAFGDIIECESRGIAATWQVDAGSLAGKTSFAETGARAMRLMIEIAAAALLLSCISATSAALAAGKAGNSADGLSCSFSVAKAASPASRCAAIKRQCGGKFYANYCGDKLLSAM